MLRKRNQSDAADHTDVEVLGKTGQTVIYVFPSGNAQVERGKVAGEPSHTPSKPQPNFDQQDSKTAPVTETPKSPVAAVERLVQAGLLSAIQQEVVQYDQAATGMTVEEILIARGWFNEETMMAFLH